jgi:2,4-dienoyl-CoA reductase-like NADH-dependent reductase (Old Yellow Enzyme family)
VHSQYPHIFSPIKLGPVEVPNRFYFSPHGVGLTIGTKPTDDFIAYKVARVKGGGCGLVVVSMTVHDRGRLFQPCPYPEDTIPAFRALADAVHAAGGKIFAELWYWWGMTGHWQPFSPPAPSLGASTVQFGVGGRTMSTHGLSREEIRALAGVFRRSVQHLREAGYDGIMLHSSHGGILEQFLSPYFNRRTDEYGGSLENRMRLLLEVLQTTREAAGTKLAVGMRFNCDELLPGGYDTNAAREILKKVCSTGLVDFVDLDIAVEPNQLYYGMPPVFVQPQVYRPYVEAVRDAVGDIPVLSVLGRLTSIAAGEAVIASGLCDMVGAARALIAEPELVKNAYEGKEDRSRTCIACNWCLSALGEGAQGCSINDTFNPAPRRSKVIIVGAGPAGLEAARVSALKGHDVTVFEARDKLGGALALWAGLPGREFFQHSIVWWEGELDRLNVKLRRGAEAKAAMVLAEKPDAVIVATGALYCVAGHSSFLDADIPGHDRDFVCRPEDILLGGARPSGKVVLLDGEGLHTSLGVAEVLARGGASVEYLSASISPISAQLVENQDERFLMKRLREAGVSFAPATYIRKIGDHEVSIYDVYTEQERTIRGVDAVVLSTARVPQNGLAKELEGKVAQLFTVGDALAARSFACAPYEGQKFARYIGEPNAPKTVGEAYFQADPPEIMPFPAEVPRPAPAISR